MADHGSMQCNNMSILTTLALWVVDMRASLLLCDTVTLFMKPIGLATSHAVMHCMYISTFRSKYLTLSHLVLHVATNSYILTRV